MTGPVDRINFPLRMNHPNGGTTVWNINDHKNLTQTYYDKHDRKIFSWEILPEDVQNLVLVLESYLKFC